MIGYKLVRPGEKGYLSSSFIGVTSYHIGVPVYREEGWGGLCVFSDPKFADIYCGGKGISTHKLLLKCEYVPSIHKYLRSIDKNGAEIFTPPPYPKGTRFADKITLLEA